MISNETPKLPEELRKDNDDIVEFVSETLDIPARFDRREAAAEIAIPQAAETVDLID